MSEFAKKEIEVKAIKRLIAAKEARDNLLTFMKLTMPDPEDPDDPYRSRYDETPLARLLCQIMEKVERRELKRVCVSVGPQLGKSQILSRGAPAWMTGRNPYLNTILGTYNQPFAEEFGDAVREIVQSPAYKQVFPELQLRKSATDLHITEHGGRTAFVGRGGSGTGKPADIFIVDDPLKDDTEAQSPTIRNQLWSWFNKVALTRCHEQSSIVVVHTRWHTDDLIGRLADPDHPERNKAYAGIADRWQYINLPAVVDDPKLAKALGLTLEPPKDPNVISMFGTKPMSSIWPGRKGLSFLAEAKQMDSQTFGALYMGKPTPDDGVFFKAQDLIEYDPEELPANLRKYSASDHAVSKKADRDYTVIGTVGIDEQGTIWVLPDLFWQQVETNETVEEILRQMKIHKPTLWWMEDELISKSFGPFLRERMQQEKIYRPIAPVRPSADKKTRARSMQGLTQLRRVRFPRFASWWPDAKAQMLRFPMGANDDFVDFMAHIGLGLDSEVSAFPTKSSSSNVVEVGSPVWVLKQAEARAKSEMRKNATAGW